MELGLSGLMMACIGAGGGWLAKRGPGLSGLAFMGEELSPPLSMGSLCMLRFCRCCMLTMLVGGALRDCV